MKFEFAKYHGLGNDFLLMDDPDGTLQKRLTPERIRQLCARQTGVGADGILLRQRTAAADHRMVLFNADGSPAEISGNGLRCFVLFLHDAGFDASRELSIETGGGIMRARRIDECTVESTMPPPDFAGKPVPAPLTLTAQGEAFTVLPVSVGNPHGVIFGPARDVAFARAYGPDLEHNPVFPAGANIEFVHVVSPRECRLVVWERGAGITLACGSGSVAATCAGAAAGHFDFDAPVAVHQPGGTLHITVASGFREIRQRGPAQFVFRGRETRWWRNDTLET